MEEENEEVDNGASQIVHNEVVIGGRDPRAELPR